MAAGDIDGLEALNAKFNKMVAEIGPVSDKAVMDVAQDLKGRSQEICPVGETGDLVGSAAVKPQPDGSVEVGYYGTIYAWRQHEELDWRHKPGKQAKYLETPFAQNLNRYIRYIADASKKVFA